VPTPDPLRDAGVRVGNYKCFSDPPQGFEHTLAFNVIIGRNNAGKSALLDLLEHIVKKERPELLSLDGKEATIILSAPITQGDTDRLGGAPDWGTKNRAVGKRMDWSPQRERQVFIGSDPIDPPLPAGFWEPLANNKPNPFFGRRFARLRAERDISPEAPGAPYINSSENGTGLTRTLHHFLTSASRDEKLVEKIMLDDLNAIFQPDTTFTRIAVREEGNKWEVWLDEKGKNERIRLSRSGSGLKTIILVLAYLHLIPALEGKPAQTYFFAFEELENNLHPALQRRLLRFLHDFSKQRESHFFLTTHSPVEIDYFARDIDAQILHVTNDGSGAKVRPVSAYSGGKTILDDLDIRASDILQSNGIIWVEGPSDRAYLNRWIELFTDGALREGAHYQILQYGGSLLAQLDADSPGKPSETIHILTTNRNAAVLMDSDKKTAEETLEGTKMGKTKRRIIEELKRVDGLSWVTAGRTIENYIPDAVLATTLTAVPGMYDDMIEFIRARNPKAATKLPSDKVTLARRIVPMLKREHLATTLDLEARVRDICERIRAWNRM
jgi:putative ATP-dependent endonuclease of OLD family